MLILVLIGTVGASPQIGEILPHCDLFFDCTVLSCPVLTFFARSCAQVEPLDRFLPRCMECIRRGLAMRIPSVRLSVCPSVRLSVCPSNA